MFLRQQFLEYICQTSEIPQSFEISRARGCYLFDKNDVAYLDFISGFGVGNIGYGVPEVLDAICRQSQLYLHSNVYGEHVQHVQIKLAEKLADLLPAGLNSFYFLSSGSEAVDAAIKLARLATGRTEIIVCKNAYHGSTVGAESLRSDELHRAPFLPLLPGIRFIEFGKKEDLQYITKHTAAIITEVVQAEAGVRTAPAGYWKMLRQKCNENQSLLILDEIQTGLGRTGKLFAFMHENLLPDLLLCGKALGAGMPLSALVGNRALLAHLFKKLPLAHISTFGGHPVSCAAALAGLHYLNAHSFIETTESKGQFFESQLRNTSILGLRRKGLFMAIDFHSKIQVLQIIRKLFDQKILAEGFLFAPQSLRIAPPLCIEETELKKVAEVIGQI